MVAILRESPLPVTTGQMLLQCLPAFDDNYIWLLRNAGARALVVDPGDAAPVLAVLGDAPPLAILLTHHHGDHIGGVADLLARWPGTPVFAPHDDRIPQASRRVADGEQLAIGDWRFAVLAVPGHTRSHVAYHGEGLLFCGDTLFSLGCGRLFEGTPAQMQASLARLATLPGDTRVCCAHEYTASNIRWALQVEPDNAALQQRALDVTHLRAQGQPTLPSTIGLELETNPFLHSRQPAVRAAAARQTGASLDTPQAVFAALRQWKNDFR